MKYVLHTVSKVENGKQHCIICGMELIDPGCGPDERGMIPTWMPGPLYISEGPSKQYVRYIRPDIDTFQNCNAN